MTSAKSVVREVKAFEFYKKYIWPVQRTLVKKHLTPRCRRCFLPESYARLEKGICEFCRTDDPAASPVTKAEQNKMQAGFENLMASVITRDDLQYHAVVLFSGGKDSSWLLHHMMTRYRGLRLLALTVDNTFMSPVAMDNIKDIIQTLGVEHMIFRPDAGVMEKMFRFAFTHLNEKGCAGTVDQFDGDFFCDAARNIAARMGIPYILCGLSRDQVQQILGLDNFITRPEAEAARREQVAGIELSEIFSQTEMQYWWDGPAWQPEQRPRMLFPFYIRDYEETYIKAQVLKLNLMPRGDESPLVTNNTLVPLMGIVDMVTFGYSSFEPEFARMVRNSKANRKDWLYTFETLEYAARTGHLLGRAVDEVLERLSLSRADLGIKGGSHD